jgi:hypothetical protein
MDPIIKTPDQLIGILQSLDAPAVITKNNRDDLEERYRPRPRYPLDMLDGHWRGRPARIRPNQGYAIHLVEHRNWVWLGFYCGVQGEKGKNRYSLIVGNAQCFEVPKLNFDVPAQSRLSGIFRQPFAMTYSYFTPGSGSGRTAEGVATMLAEPPEERERKYELRLEAYRRNSAHVRFLRDLYEGRCQLCGSLPFEGEFGKLSEGHHIKWLSRDGIDEKENIIMLCPNHHAAIHQLDPQFDPATNIFYFWGGDTPVRVKLDLHLKASSETQRTRP